MDPKKFDELLLVNETNSLNCLMTEWDLLKDTATHKLYLFLTPFIIGIGFFGNILAVCVFILTDLKRQSVSIITIALAIADTFVLIIPVAILWFETISKQELTDTSQFWCRTHGSNEMKQEEFFIFLFSFKDFSI